MDALDETKSNDWKHFFAVAGRTIMKDKTVAGMKDNVNKLAKAPSSYVCMSLTASPAARP
eukprot:4404463-Heterocapsa_arctica.AAC.1